MRMLPTNTCHLHSILGALGVFWSLNEEKNEYGRRIQLLIPLVTLTAFSRESGAGCAIAWPWRGRQLHTARFGRAYKCDHALDCVGLPEEVREGGEGLVII